MAKNSDTRIKYWMPWHGIDAVPRDGQIALRKLESLGYKLDVAPPSHVTQRLLYSVLKRAAPVRGRFDVGWTVIYSDNSEDLHLFERILPVAYAVQYHEPVCNLDMTTLSEYLDGKDSYAKIWEESRLIMLERLSLAAPFADRRFGQYYAFFNSLRRGNRALMTTVYTKNMPDDDDDAMDALCDIVRRSVGDDAWSVIMSEAKLWRVKGDKIQ